MSICAYCLEDKKLTREHLFPKAISNSIEIEEREIYLDKSPRKIIDSKDIVIKDVCADCNNIILGELDEYGKKLYIEYFSKIIKDDKVYNFSYDYNKLFRWLLKISYNSGRVHNADVDILNNFREYILGKSNLPPNHLMFLHLIAPYKDVDTGEIEYPVGWRVSQLRLPTRRVINCAQRCIFINSYCFTLFILDPKEKVENLELFKTEFLTLTPNACHLSPTSKLVKVKIGNDNAISSLAPHWFLNPSLYKINENELEGMLKGKGFKIVGFIIERDEIEKQDIERTLNFLKGLLFSREMVLLACQTVELMINGYNEDKREVYEVPEIKSFIRKFHKEFPYWHFFLNPKMSFIKVLPLCLYNYSNIDGKLKISAEDFEYHLSSQFDFINEICHRFVISDEKNKEITKNLAESYLRERA